MKSLFILIIGIHFCACVQAQGITLLYKNDLGWQDHRSWVQINIPASQTPIQRVPTAEDDVVFSYSMSGIASAGIRTNDANPDFNIGGSSPKGPARCRSLEIRNTTFIVDNLSLTDNSPDVNVYTANGGYVKIDSGANMGYGHFRLHGGNPNITDLQILNSTYGILFSHAQWSSITWKSGASFRAVGSTVRGDHIKGEPGGNMYVDSSIIETYDFNLGNNSTATLKNTRVTNYPDEGILTFFIGKNSNFVSANVTVSPLFSLRFTTSGSQLNGNVTTQFPAIGLEFLQADPANPLPNIINGNLVVNTDHSIGISGDLKISGNFTVDNTADSINNPIPVIVNGQNVFSVSGIKNYRSSAFINNCVDDFCHFKLEFFGNTNSHISWKGGIPIDTLIVNKTNCAKVTSDNSLYVSGATKILGGQLRLYPDDNIPYTFVSAGDVDIAAGGGMFLGRDASGKMANIAVAGKLTDHNNTSDSLCVGFSNPYKGIVTTNSIIAVPDTLVDFYARYNNNTVELGWSTLDELITKHFILEKAPDQVSFSPITTIAAMGGPGKKDYRFTDQSTFQRTNYFRIKIVDTAGRFTYSKVLAVQQPGSITLLYKNNLGWHDPQSWVQINIPVSQSPIQRVPTAEDDVVISSSMSGIASVVFTTDNINPDFNIGGSGPKGPARCRSMRISNTMISIENTSMADGAPDVNVYTSNGGYVIIDSGSNMLRGHFRLHGGNTAVTNLQILNSSYGSLSSNSNRSSIRWKKDASLRVVGSKIAVTNFEGEPGGSIFIDQSSIETTSFKLGDNSTASLLNSKVTNNSGNNALEFFIGKNSNFVSANDTVLTYSHLKFTTSGTQFNGNVVSLGEGPGNIDFLQADPANPLPNIINGNFSASKIERSIGISGALKISGNFSGAANDVVTNPIPVVVDGKEVFTVGGIKNYGSGASINNCVQNFCHFRLEFFGSTNSHLSWNGGFPIDTLVINKTNCAKLTSDNSLYVSGATKILGGQLRLYPNDNIPYKFISAGNVDIAVGGGLFLGRDAAGKVAKMIVLGKLTDLNPKADSLCLGLSDPYKLMPIPDTLLDFTGKYNNNVVELDWSTANELNSKFFIVEKSADQVSFFQVTTIAASGGPGIKDYRHTDQALATGTNYYRIKILHTDGRVTYSKIVVVDVPVSISVTVLPNPVGNRLQLRLGARDTDTEVTLIDGKGTLLQRIKLRAGTTDASINTAGLPPGVYFLSIQSNNVKYSGQFIKN